MTSYVEVRPTGFSEFFSVKFHLLDFLFVWNGRISFLRLFIFPKFNLYEKTIDYSILIEDGVPTKAYDVQLGKLLFFRRNTNSNEGEYEKSDI